MTSIRQYARHRKAAGLPGGTPKAVRAARDSGRLSRAISADGKQILDVVAADAEWAGSTNADRVPLAGRTSPRVSTSPPSSTAPAPSRLYDRTLHRWVADTDLFAERDALSVLVAALVADARAKRDAPALASRIAAKLSEVAEHYGADGEVQARAMNTLASTLELLDVAAEDA